jgi:hypothetical protein
MVPLESIIRVQAVLVTMVVTQRLIWAVDGAGIPAVSEPPVVVAVVEARPLSSEYAVA